MTPVSEPLARASSEEKRRLLAEAIRRKSLRSKSFPTSFAQQRLWFLAQVDAGSAWYNNPAIVRLKGALDVEALGSALNEIVRRHEALRTTFASVDGRPLQVIASALTIPVRVADLTTLPAESREAVAAALAVRDTQRPFDLARGPLVRVQLVRLTARDHLLALTLHHIVSDAWSIGVLVREFSTLYRAYASRLPSPLPELPIQYADFAVWQRDWLQGERLAEQLGYWRAQLDGIAAATLPTDRPRPTRPDPLGALEGMVIPAPLANGLRTLSQREATTLFITLLSAFLALLHRYTGQRDLAVGSAIANRHRVELEGLIGFFVNTLVLRVRLARDLTVRDLLARAQEVALGAYAHQDLPFEKIVEELHPERTLSENPLFGVVFGLQNASAPRLDLQGLESSYLDTPVKTVRFDLEFQLFERSDVIECVVEYRTALFDRTTIQRLMRQFVTVLEAVVADPAQPLGDLPLLTAAEAHHLLIEWNDTAAPPSKPECVHEIFARQAAGRAEAIALVFEEEQVTYEVLDRRANQLAWHLRGMGVGPEAVVGLCVERSIELLVGLLGILKAGAAYVPLDPTYPPERLAFMAADAAVKTVVTTARLAGQLPAREVRRVQLDTEWPVIARENAAPPALATSPEQLAYVLYTSGSTGQPKAVGVEHRQLTNYVTAIGDRLALSPGLSFATNVYLTADLGHTAVFPSLASGGCLHLLARARLSDGDQFADYVSRHPIDCLKITPTHLAALVDAASAAAVLPHQHLLLGGERADAALLEKLSASARCRSHNHYGPTETTVGVLMHQLDRDEDSVALPLGRPLANTRAYIVDAGLQPVPAGATGELYVGGACVSRGYVTRPDLTAERFVPDPFSPTPGGRLYKTGDLARQRRDGAIEFLGRADRQIKIRGFRIEPGEIEQVLAQHSAVRQSVVLATDGSAGDPQLVAYVVPRSGLVAESASAASSPSAVGHGQHRLPNNLVVAHLHRHETSYLYEEIFERRAYLQHGISVPDAGVVFDVGANIGLFTLFVREQSKHARIFAFEPVPAICEILRSNVAQHEIGATVLNCGLSRAAGTSSFKYYERFSILSGVYGDPATEKAVVRSYIRSGRDSSAENVEELETYADTLLDAGVRDEPLHVQLRTLSDVIAEYGVDRIDLLKINAEKSEADIIAGIRDEDWPKIGQIVMEVDTRANLANVVPALESRGFEVDVVQDARLAQTDLCYVYAKPPAASRGDRRPTVARTASAPDLRQVDAGGLEQEKIEDWTATFDSTYREATAPSDPAFNIAGWRSSYTGEAIAREEMEAWVAQTIARIGSVAGQRVLEIGCGTGLLLFRLAGKSGLYWGSDFSSVALAGVREEVARRRWRHVRLWQRPADDFTGIEAGSFDAVIVNSVVQYFPSAAYLERVLRGAVNAVRPGGRVFVGDVRHLGGLTAFHTSVQVTQAAASARVGAVRAAVQRAVAREPELVIAPAAFAEIVGTWPTVTTVELSPKTQGAAELTRYRYDVVVRVGRRGEAGPVPASMPWTSEAGVRERIAQEPPPAVRISGVPDARVSEDLAWVKALAAAPDEEPIAELRRRMTADARTVSEAGVAPAQWETLGRELGYTPQFDLTAPFGTYDVLLRRAGTSPRPSNAAVVPREAASANGEPHETSSTRSWDGLTNRPLSAVWERQLSAELRHYLQGRLPEHLVPAAFVVLTTLPRTPSGKIDVRALPAPEGTARPTGAGSRPRTAVEELLVRVWADVLGLTRVGIHDNFFDLGGHSLLATRLLSQIRKTFRVEIGLTAFFDGPTIVETAAMIEQARLADLPPAPPIVRLPRSGPVPLSFAQQRLWFLAQMDPQSASYNSAIVARLDGALDVAALTAALTEVVRRHEALRTGFAMVDGEPQQIVVREARLPLTCVDFTALPASSREAAVEAAVTAETQRAFDLTRTPMLRAVMLRVADRSHVLAVTLHHIASDAWSVGVLIREVSALYNARRERRPSPLPELPIQYADFAVWQRTWLQGDVLAEQLAYWKRQLDGVPALTLPTDRPRPRGPHTEGASEALTLPPTVVDRLLAFSQAEGVTLFMTLLAAFQTLLYRYTGQGDIAVGSPIANRNRVELEELIGFFVNTLVLRVPLGAGLAFRDVLQRVRDVAVGAYAHQDLPFEKLVAELHPERELNENPLFQVMFILQNAPAETLALEGIEVRVPEVAQHTAKFDLTLFAWHTSRGLSLHAEYKTALFDRSTIQRQLRQFVTVLDAVVADPAQSIGALPLLTAAEAHHLLIEWNDTAAPPRQPLGVHEIFAREAADRPDALAVIFEDEQISYGELDRRANQLAWHLRGAGVASESVIGLCIERSAEMLVGLLGILKAGAAYLPLDAAYPPDRLAFMIADAAVQVVVTTARLGAQLPARGGRRVQLDTNWPAIARERSTPPTVAIDPDQLAYVLYTSGSTGQPKGVAATHASTINRFEWMWSTYPFDRDEVACQKTSLGFVDSVWEIFGPLLKGIPLVVIADDEVHDPSRFVETLARHDVTRVVLVPSLIRAIFDVMPARLPLRTLRHCILSGEALPIDLAAEFTRRAPRATLLNLYGSSEVAADVTWQTVRAGDTSDRVAIGRPIHGARVHVLDRRLQPVPIGIPGEICVGGEAVARGYVDRPELTAERFVPDPFASTSGARLYRTGDLGRYRADGTLDYLGRLDRQVKRLGRRIELGEIEAALQQHPQVGAAVVVTGEDLATRSDLTAYVVPARGGPIGAAVRPMQFSIFYFAADERADGEKYRLYLEASKFADRHGFTAVWTPERHFHHVAGLYPNPAVLSAALAIATERIALRAGSVVLPLHDPVRVVEEWAAVDNLSKGRVGLSFTSGWIPNDFALRPEHFANKQEVMLQSLEIVRRLWSGHTVRRVDGSGKACDLRTFPRPLQPELPVWLTCSGHPSMFAKAGALGVNVLTALLGQNVDQAAANIRVYREARASHGHDPDAGHVTMMLHSFVGEQLEAVLDRARDPFCTYMKSHVGLIQTMLKSLDIQVGIDPEAHLDDLAATAFERYTKTASLIGTPEMALRMVETMRGIGVDEVACLVDFGLGVDDVLESLGHLEAVRRRDEARAADAGGLDRFLASRLPAYMIPKTFVTLDALPLLPNGKIDRRALPAVRPAADVETFVAPETETERDVASAWAELLQLDRVSIDANFFMVGGHSLAAIQLMSRIQRSFGVSLTVKDLFAAPTIRALASRLDDALIARALESGAGEVSVH